MKTNVVGGVAMPHAPQFFTRPETEDPAMIERIRSLAADIGKKLKALKPDVWIVIANDHANQFLLHCVPPFTFHRGREARGSFAGTEFRFQVASEVSTALIRYLQDEQFDPAFSSTAGIDYAFGIPLTFLGVKGPIIPLYINSYIPPQPRMERCYALGQAIARGLAVIGVRAVVVASGGLSHFPGTKRYGNPDLAFDKKLMAEIECGHLRALLAFDDRRLDDTGNVELRSWAIAAGMLAERRPDLTSLEPSWHHTYGTVAWYAEEEPTSEKPHYPEIHPDRVALTGALHRLANNPEERERYLADPKAYAAMQNLSAPEQIVLVNLGEEDMLGLGIHPLVTFLARLELDRQRLGKGGLQQRG